MTIRNLEAVLAPRSVAVVGASEREGSVGRVLMRNMASFGGQVLPVNAKRDSVFGARAYPNVESLPYAPDLAVIATPAASVPGIVAALAAAGTRGAVVISAGFGANGRALERAMLEAARPYLLRVVGPNTLGIAVPRIGLNASFAQLDPARGELAFLAQSGAVATSVLDWAHARGIGFSHVIALGDMADVDFGDMLDYLANDPGTRAILMYVEAVTHPRKFMSAARAAAREKPVIVVKSGRHAASAGAAASHTGRLAGPDAEYDAAFRRAGMLRVATLEELFDAVETLANARTPRGGRLTIVTNGGGLGVLAADELLARGGELAEPDSATLARLDEVLPAAWSHGNPIDIVGDATPERYARALDVVLDDPACDAALVLHCPTALSTGVATASAVAQIVAARSKVPVLTSWLGEHTARAAREELARAHVPTYDTPEAAVRAFMQMVDYRRNQATLIEMPPSLPQLFKPDTAAVGEIMREAAAARREWLADPDARRVLAAYGLPIVQPVPAATPAEAGAAAERLGRPVALKILAAGGLHKSDVGGVILHLNGAQAVESAARAMLERVQRTRPQLEVQGFAIEPMVEIEGALELIVGATSGGDFGPVIMFGEGGTAVEITNDTAVELLPLNLRLARALIARTRISRLMRGYRNTPAVDVNAVALMLTRISQLVVDWPQILEIDVNPLVASPAAVIALDARIKVTPDGAARPVPPAIRPYPTELEEDVVMDDGRVFRLRPILPEDEQPLRAAFARLTPEEVRARFFVPMRELPRLTAARFTQIDYDREMAFVLAGPGVPGVAPLHAVVNLVADPDNRAAEFAIIVEHGLSGHGLGTRLTKKLIDYARSRGLHELRADVLADNAAMLALGRSLGFVETRSADPFDRVVRVSLDLDKYIPQ